MSRLKSNFFFLKSFLDSKKLEISTPNPDRLNSSDFFSFFFLWVETNIVLWPRAYDPMAFSHIFLGYYFRRWDYVECNMNIIQTSVCLPASPRFGKTFFRFFMDLGWYIGEGSTPPSVKIFSPDTLQYYISSKKILWPPELYSTSFSKKNLSLRKSGNWNN